MTPEQNIVKYHLNCRQINQDCFFWLPIKLAPDRPRRRKRRYWNSRLADSFLGRPKPNQPRPRSPLKYCLKLRALKLKSRPFDRFLFALFAYYIIVIPAQAGIQKFRFLSKYYFIHNILKKRSFESSFSAHGLPSQPP